MTDRVHSLVVTLEKDHRIDDVQQIVEAIKMIKGVLNVTEEVSNIKTHMAEERARRELGEKLWKVIFPKVI